MTNYPESGIITDRRVPTGTYGNKMFRHQKNKLWLIDNSGSEQSAVPIPNSELKLRLQDPNFRESFVKLVKAEGKDPGPVFEAVLGDMSAYQERQDQELGRRIEAEKRRLAGVTE